MEKVILMLLKLYRYAVSPWFGQVCRFYPSCSQYAESVIQEWGIWKGAGMTVRRLLKCHPWHAGGYDPAPLNHHEDY